MVTRLLQSHDQLLNLRRQLVGLSVRSSATIGQLFDTAVFRAFVNLEAGFSRNAELTAQSSQLLTIQEASNELETFFHGVTLLPGHDGSLP